MLLPTQHMSIIFSPREFIIWFKSIQAKQVDLETSSLTQLLHDLMHWSLLRSLLTTYERSTCDKSKNWLKRAIKYLQGIVPLTFSPPGPVTEWWGLQCNVVLTFDFVEKSYGATIQMKPILAVWYNSIFSILTRLNGSLYVSGELPTCPSPRPTFCPKWEVRFNVDLGEG